MVILGDLLRGRGGVRATWFYLALFGFGLALRVLFLNQAGTSDIDSDLQWGEAANKLGLPSTFHGIYLPLQYQVFQFVAGLSSIIPVSGLVVFKTVNLVADVGVLFLLLLLLRRWSVNPAYALVYWLHPYFLAIFWLGYIDVQFAFLVMLGLLALTRAASSRDHLVAGIPFGIAWLMKPQPIIGAVMIALYGGILLAEAAVTRNRHIASRVTPLAALFVAPVLFYLCYEVWFTLETGSITRLFSESYHGVVDVMPALTAQMLNIWHPVAQHYRTEAQPIYYVNGPDSLHALAKAITAVILLTAALATWRFAKTRKNAIVVLVLFCLGAAILPMTMTRAHENHFFLAGTLLVALCAVFRSKVLNSLVIAFLFIQFMNLFGLYGFGDNKLSELQPFAKVQNWYTLDVRNTLAFISVALFAAMLSFICLRLVKDNEVGSQADQAERKMDSCAPEPDLGSVRIG